jgi:hypothetical protein
MPENKSRFVLFCQQAFVLAVVGAVALSALGVVELRIEPPGARAAWSSAGAMVATAPVKPRIRTVALGDGRAAGFQSRTTPSGSQAIRAVSEPEPVSGYATVGITWSGDRQPAPEAVTLEVRTRSGGPWSPWQPLAYDPDHDPEPAEAGDQLRAGSEPLVVGDVDEVQVRASSRQALPDLALALIDPGTDAAPVDQQPAIATDPEPAAAPDPETGDESLALSAAKAPAAPAIFSRAQWGADERLRDEDSLRYGTIKAGFVHHTVNANDYDREDVPSIIRGIYAYHTRTRGWSDVGYNFLVDRFGRIWEGRYGGVNRPVVGAHTLGYNEESFAMSAIGNFETAEPTSALLRAYGALFAWKLALHDVDAGDTSVVVNGDRFQAINGHRDAGSTACPGQHLYDQLPRIRRLAAEGQRTSRPVTPTAPPPAVPTTRLNLQLSGQEWPDLVVRDRVTRHALIVRTAGQLGFRAGRVIGTSGWRGAVRVVAPGDLDGDRTADVIVQTRARKAYLVHGRIDGTLTRRTPLPDRFAGLNQLTGVGDFDGDRRPDLVGRTVRGQLVLYRGRGDGTFAPGRLLAADWRRFEVTRGAGDLDRDGRADLLARDGATMYLVRGTGSGLRTPRALPGRWQQYDALTGRADLTGDRIPDLVARVRATGLTYLFPGDGAGGFKPRTGGWTRFQGVTRLTVVGQVTGSTRPDVVGIDVRGRLLAYGHNDRANLGRVIDTGTVLGDIDLLLSVGDWNGDGRGDVMTRRASTGALHLRLGRTRGRLGAPVQVRADFRGVTRLAAVGDMTGDGYPDLVGRDSTGKDRVYPSNGTTGFAASTVLRPTVRGRRQVGLGFWDGDRKPDTGLLRNDGTLVAWSSANGRVTPVADGLRRYRWVRGLGDLDGDGRADVVAKTAGGGLFLLRGAASGLDAPRLIGTGFGAYDLVG